MNAKPEAEGGRDVVVTPIADEADLYYHDWVQGNIKKVSRGDDGKVGYLHVPDMLATGLNEFAKHFYPQLRKKALIIDVRGNGGGNVSPMLIERLRREIAMIAIARNTAPERRPGGTFYGPMVCLMNEFSASDGDMFPYRFRQYKLGQADRQAELGRRGRHPRHAAAARRRHAQQAGVLALRRGGQGVDHRGPRRRPGHRGRQRPGQGVRRRGPAAQQGDRGDAGGAEEEPAEAGRPAALPEAVGGEPKPTGKVQGARATVFDAGIGTLALS